MGFVQEFKEFAMKGNVVDMAVGVIIGTAFGGIVNSLINDMIMPVVGKIIGNVDFTNLYIPLSDAVSTALATNPKLPLSEARKLGAVLAYGNFITIVINFLILALCIFMMVKAMNKAMRKPLPAPAVPPPPTKEEVLLTEIRDAIRAKH
jgi:large conductance mechanosensitive channel